MEKSFGEFLKYLRQTKNLTQKELANLLFVSESAVSKWEKDIAHPDISLLPKISEILGVTEHELITASIDKHSREEKVQAKKWRAFSMSWSLFFYISYAIALIPCFICDLAINKGLSWFWIVLSSLLLAFSFTNLPKLIKKHKLILIPVSMFLSLCLLLAVCCIYTKGDWFLLTTLAIFFGLVIIFAPIYITKLKLFSKIKKYADFVSIGVDFIILNILLIVINIYSVTNNYTANNYWYFKIALPIVITIYIFLNLILCVRFIKMNRFLKTSLVLFLIDLFCYTPPLFLKSKNQAFKEMLNDANVFNSNLSSWKVNYIDANIHCIICLTLLGLSLIFLITGLIRHIKRKNENKI